MMAVDDRRPSEGMPAWYRRGAGLAAVGTAVGAALGDLAGWWLIGEEGHWLLAGVGAALGAVAGYLLAPALGRRLGPAAAERLERGADRLGALLGLLLTAAGVVAFVRTGHPVGLLGAAFFALCAWYLWSRHRT